jgi:hypothetical protein
VSHDVHENTDDAGGPSGTLGELELWGDPLPAEPAPPGRVAWYLTKWRRRLPKVVIAVSLLLLLAPVLGLATWGNLDVGLPSMQYLWLPALATAGFALVCSLVLTTVVTFVWGRQVSSRQRRRSRRILWPVAAGLLLVLAGAMSWFVRPPGSVEPRTVASEMQGCHVYFAVVEEAAEDGASGAGVHRYLRPLEAAARSQAPGLVDDLQHYFQDEAWSGVNATTRAVVERCVAAGWLTTGDTNEFDRRMALIEEARQ